ncbi:MAG: type I restriction enzyme HsdR N-terminal domain-containing protein, partial [Bacteroidales bacterium]|nr:type I restriction enzyme HsdR N-terminal domain-containing protein [Bacteroidales bacterium]
MENFKIRKSPAIKGKQTSQTAFEIYDPVRKKYVALTPEEKIRQHTISFLNSALHYPYGCMGIECGLHIGDMFFRTDIVIRNKKAEVVMIIECKQQQISLEKSAEEQIL